MAALTKAVVITRIMAAMESTAVISDAIICYHTNMIENFCSLDFLLCIIDGVEVAQIRRNRRFKYSKRNVGSE